MVGNESAERIIWCGGRHSSYPKSQNYVIYAEINYTLLHLYSTDSGYHLIIQWVLILNSGCWQFSKEARRPPSRHVHLWLIIIYSVCRPESKLKILDSFFCRKHLNGITIALRFKIECWPSSLPLQHLPLYFTYTTDTWSLLDHIV